VVSPSPSLYKEVLPPLSHQAKWVGAAASASARPLFFPPFLTVLFLFCRAFFPSKFISALFFFFERSPAPSLIANFGQVSFLFLLRAALFFLPVTFTKQGTSLPPALLASPPPPRRTRPPPSMLLAASEFLSLLPRDYNSPLLAPARAQECAGKIFFPFCSPAL